MPGAAGTPSSDITIGVNEVLLVGRLAAEALERELPSGDTLWTWRVIVDRPQPAGSRSAPSSGRAKVDTIDCATYAKALGRKVSGWQPGQLVEVSGSLRRRFFKAGGAPASRYEVEVTRASRLG